MQPVYQLKYFKQKAHPYMLHSFESSVKCMFDRDQDSGRLLCIVDVVSDLIYSAKKSCVYLLALNNLEKSILVSFKIKAQY